MHALAEAGCLVAPAPPAPSMTVTEAARLLCTLSRTRRLDDPDVDYVQLLGSDAMVDYAWEAAIKAGIPPTSLPQAHEARRLLLAHHGLIR